MGPVNDQQALVDLEEAGWRALSTPGAGADFYDDVLDKTVVMLFPGGIRLEDRDVILGSMSGQPWSSYEIDRPRAYLPTPDTGLVVYGVVARREDYEYSALVSSMYVRRADGWKMAFHQQTPR